MKRTSPSTGASFPIYLCQICLSTYSTIGHLRRHEAVHAGQRLYGCHFCDQHFFRSDAARRHSRSCANRGDQPMPPLRPRGKQKQSCDSCAKSKRACSRGHPCEACQLSKVPCTYYRSTGNHEGPQPFQTTQETGASLQQLHGSVPAQSSEAGNKSPAPSITPQEHRVKFDFLLKYTTPGKDSLLDFFGSLTNTIIPNPTISTLSAPSSTLFMPSSSLLGFPNELEDLMQGNSLPMLDDFIWNSETSTPSIDPSLLYSSRLESRLQELISRLAIAQDKIFKRCGGDAPPFSEEVKSVLLTVPNLVDFTRLYFEHWHPNSPVIHQPTYNLETVSLPLLFAVFLIGAAYSSPRDTASLATQCGTLCEEFVFEDDEVKSILRTEQGFEGPTSLQAVQAALLVAVLQTWQNGPEARTRMRKKRYSDIVTMTRTLGYTSSKNMYATGICPFNWLGYVEAEAKIRVMATIYLIDAYFTVFHSYPPRMMVSEMVGDMPSSDEAYAATDALVCEGYLIGTNEKPRASLATSVAWLMGDEWNAVHHYQLTTYNLFTLLNALNNTSFLLKSSAMGMYNSDRIVQALDRWKILWDDHIEHVGPEFSRIGYYKNSLEFWQLAKLVLKVEGSSEHMELNKSLQPDEGSLLAIYALVEKFQGASIS
ncbi:5adcff4b-b7b5-4f5f-af1b-8c894e5f0d47 [Sclerotinia trifoliorum]|uniref:5adcff4b-b7b5-4f5f-af1b-8c894e5f0d47 n=1 Tax=Sclerotinia trifoliorum TaxID=28548 RepID=A0A8H2VQ08_9HELO|nr:5adcff4b-b7b5-4f5f-af1b-8c894e5f0d47 [Sclerotinia trifoliorum]